VRSRFKRQLIRLNMKKKWPTRTEMTVDAFSLEQAADAPPAPYHAGPSPLAKAADVPSYMRTSRH